MLRVLTVQPALEQAIVESRLETAGGAIAALEPETQKKWINELASAVRDVQQQGRSPIVLCSEAARPLIKSSSRIEIPDLVVLSVPEIVSDIKIESLGEIRIDEE